MTTDPHDEHGEILRRALHAEADSVSPADDGLDLIRARIADPRRRRWFGLERFGTAWYGLDRFTLNWARPALAVAAAVAIAGLGVTAPQTIDLIQQSVGNNGPSGGGHDDHTGDHVDAQGHPILPGSPKASQSGSAGSESPSASASPSPSSSPTPCTTPGVGDAKAPKPSDTAKKHGAKASASPCPSGTPTASPTPTPTPSTPPPSTPTQPTEQPTPPATSAPATTTEQGTGASAP
ncbi:hypothetical protein [Actinomadura violacea]|uniref:Uncharacterized protein n=1 Tax=Actinomadura violacea TaxID=2819934 RepID=A0ABS3RTQ0_9ACTN|nr:hypothetical protein [Actinomadura violacea]MBO2459683.1 hypothetical protein [Actinomadura violacea]